MKLYLECAMGASGDMLMGALLELLPDRDSFIQKMRDLGLPGVAIGYGPAVKCGVSGTKMRISVGGEEETSKDVVLSGEHAHGHKHEQGHDHGDGHAHTHVFAESGAHTHEDAHGHTHAHYTYSDICALIGKLDIPGDVRDDALAVYTLIGEAESAVHGVPIDQIHFHEVGSLDAVVDVVGCALLFHMLGATTIEATPVHVGSGFVRCAHGILPVPAPATARILQGVPIYGGKIKGELCTPTGAALLKHFVRRFGDLEQTSVTKIGYGMGAKDFEAANCLRAFMSDGPGANDTVVELRCNLDDMTPEAVGFATELLLEHGALDVFTTPITMKKNRPAVMLTCLCRPDDKNDISRLLLENTTTLGVRYETMCRDILDTESYKVATPYGDIRIKSARGFGLVKEKPEYDDVRAAAVTHGVPFFQVYAAAAAAMKSHQN
jgi:uncharacterized protein (TIGR00299 family) protein